MHIIGHYDEIRFPTNGEIAQKWKEALGMQGIQKQITGNVCADHFSGSDFKRKNKTELKPNVIPSMNLLTLANDSEDIVAVEIVGSLTPPKIIDIVQENCRYS